MNREAALNGRQWVTIINAMATAVAAQQAMLSALDAAIGDGDHGVNMAHSLAAASENVDRLNAPTPTAVLKETGTTVMNEMGGASGMVFGAFFKGCARPVPAAAAVDKEAVAEMLAAGLAQVQKRGKAQVGDKTMVDALAPAVTAYQEAIQNGGDLITAIAQAAQAAAVGAAATEQMVARFGRAKFLGERSLGHRDAGAATMALLFAAWAEVLTAEIAAKKSIANHE